MKILTGPIDTEKIKENLITASAIFMALKPYDANFDANHGNYFITKETVENVKENLYTKLKSIREEMAPIDFQITRNHLKNNHIENENDINEDLRKIFTICDFCLEHKGNIDD